MLRNLQNPSWHFRASLGLMAAGATIATALAVSRYAFSPIPTQLSSC